MRIVDVRLVGGTNVDLPARFVSGQSRADLDYRLSPRASFTFRPA